MDDTNIVLFALHIAGAAALLIWAVRLLRTGVERAYAVQLRSFLRRSNSSRLQAAASGIFAALCLQSATAVAAISQMVAFMRSPVKEPNMDAARGA